MTIQEWSTQVSDELKAAGFTVESYQGFPLVKPPTSMAEGVRFLKLKLTLPIDRTFYAEGVLITPAGSNALRREGGGR